MSQKRNVLIIGCCGKMGQTVCRYLFSHTEYRPVAGVDVSRANEDLGLMLGLGTTDILISDNLQKTLSEQNIDVAIDFTTPNTVVSNASVCLQNKVPVIIGTTGINSDNLKMLELLSENTQTPVLIVPNFAIGAVLMAEFAKKAAQYMKNVEIIELHHNQKIDKPSGTAIKTRQGILEAQNQTDKESDENYVPIHSIRLPGLVAHQEVIFGDVGQTLTIRHDSLNRDSFMPGISLALEQIKTAKGLEIGLKL